MTPLSEVINFFEKTDTKVAEILKEIPFDDWFGKEILDDRLIFESLCRTIVGQQLAGKAAEAIFKRFALLCEGKVTPEIIKELDGDTIRNAGLSWAKVRSVKDLAEKVLTGELELKKLPDLSDEELINELVKVKGIGRWTAEMFLMFRLGREDIFSWGDLGLKNGLKKFLGKDELDRDKTERLVASWAPYRTYGAIAMWHLLDNR